jgi:hypothetical protein
VGWEGEGGRGRSARAAPTSSTAPGHRERMTLQDGKRVSPAIRHEPPPPPHTHTHTRTLQHSHVLLNRRCRVGLIRPQLNRVDRIQRPRHGWAARIRPIGINRQVVEPRGARQVEAQGVAQQHSIRLLNLRLGRVFIPCIFWVPARTRWSRRERKGGGRRLGWGLGEGEGGSKGDAQDGSRGKGACSVGAWQRCK